jgi:hypothetical protein
MGWLDERIIQYHFSKDDDDIIIEAPASKPRPEAPDGYKYEGMLPYKTNLMTKVQFEQNGRIGYRIDVGDGKQIYRSATREKYEHTIGNMGTHQYKKEKAQGAVDERLNESKYTKAYGEAVKKKKKENMDMHNRNLKKILKGEKV